MSDISWTQRRFEPRWSRALTILLAAAVSSVLLGGLLAQGRIHLAIALVGVALLSGLALVAPQRALLGLIAWLAAFGLIRRLAHYAVGAIPTQDPLLLVAPLTVALLAAGALRRGALRQPSRLTLAVVGLAALVVLGAANPLQGGPRVGLGGLLFILVPILWFPIGRLLVDETMMHRVLRLVGVLAGLAAAYGIYQVVGGFPPWDRLWIEQGGYVALSVDGTIRPFSSFASGKGFGTFAALGAVAYWLHRARSGGLSTRSLAVVVAGVVVLAVILQASRALVVTGLVAMAVMWAAHRGVPAGRALVSGLVALLAMYAVLNVVEPQLPADGGAGTLVSHQVTGLTNPLDPQSSTVGIHVRGMLAGLRSAVENPIGRGTGAVTIAATEFGSQGTNAEVDPGNAGFAWGIPGLIAYAALVVTASVRAYRLARLRRDALALAALGVLAVTFLQWLNGAQYAASSLVWLTLGWLDRPEHTPGLEADRGGGIAAGVPTRRQPPAVRATSSRI